MKEDNLKTVRFGRLTTQYRYNYESWQKSPWGNLGDCFQSFAVENVFKEMGIPASELLLVNRDELDVYDGKQVIVPMQGYFASAIPVAWSSKIIPVYVGFHLHTSSRKKFKESSTVERMRMSKQSIGCRDRQTADFLKSLNINAYFSGCLTLTFPKRSKEPQDGKVFLVDIPDVFFTKIPSSLREKAKVASQVYWFKKTPVEDKEYDEFESKARHQLNYFRSEARLMITSRIHAALPCIAMGIPVVFLSKDKLDCRFDLLKGILKVYTLGDDIDWNPKVPDIETIKSLVRDNAIARIKEAESYLRVINESYSFKKEEFGHEDFVNRNKVGQG